MSAEMRNTIKLPDTVGNQEHAKRSDLSTVDLGDTRGEMLSRPMVMHARVITSTGGGPDKTILNSPRYLKELGYDALCTFFHPPDDKGFEVLLDRAKDWSAPVAEIIDRGKFDWNAVRQAVSLCRDRRVNLWHAHDYKTNLIGLIVRRYHEMKLVTTAHGWVNFSGITPLYYWLDKRWWLGRYDRVICVSDTIYDECVRAGVPESRCVMIENAIDHEQFCRTRSIDEAKQQKWGVSANQLVIGSIGRLAGEKGFDKLIAAFARVVQQGIDARLVIAGEGPDEALLRRLIIESGLRDRIDLVGFCSDVREFLESIDIFVLSSLREGLPNVVLEAMAVGAPVVATNVGGVHRLVEDGVCGLLIDPNNIESIELAILKLARSPDLRQRYAQAGVQTIASKWSFRRRMAKIDAIYRSVLGESTRPNSA